MTFPPGGLIIESLEAGNANSKHLEKVRELASFTLRFISRKDSSYDDENIGSNQ
jgi:hypothetical protein